MIRPGITVALISLLAAATLLLPYPSQIYAAGPGAISIDFVGTSTAMASTETAGVVAKSRWNSATGGRSTSALALLDETGAATGATLTWTSDNPWGTGIAATAGNFHMMKGYLNNGSGNPSVITVAGLPAAAYDLYVYVDGDNGAATRNSTYQISGPGMTTVSRTLTDPPNTNFSGTFTQANNSVGNYLKFSITGNFTLTATPGAASDGDMRAPVNGLQIIPTAPSTPDFTLGVTPATQTVAPGAATSYTVSVGAISGFSNPVTLSATGLPANATASFATNPVAPGTTVTLTVTAAPNTPPGSSTVTVTGTSGSLTHTASVAFVVSPPPPPPDFTIAVSPASQTTNPGGNVTYTVMVTSVSGFTGSVNLSAGGFPAGTSYSLMPASISGGAGNATLQVSTTSGTPLAASTLTVGGTSGSISHSTTATLNVSSALAISIDFVGTSTAMASTETAGVVAKSRWNSATGGRSTSALALLDETGAATGATLTWTSDNPWGTGIAATAGNFHMMKGYLNNGSGNPSVITVAGLPAAAYDLYVYVDGDNGAATRNSTYQISGPGMTTVSRTLTDPPNTNFSGTFTQANNSVGNYLKFSITGNFTLTATPGAASDGDMRAPVNGLQIIPTAPSTPDFTLGVTPATQTVAPGAATSYTVTVGTVGGFTNPVTLSVTGLPTNATASFSTNPVTPGAPAVTLTVTAGAATPDGTSTLTVTGSSGSIAHSANPTFVVKTVPFYSMSGTITPTPAGAGVTVNLGGASAATTTTAADGTYSFNSLPAGSYSVMPAKAGYAFTPSSRTVNLSANATGLNFTIAPTHVISGTVSSAGGGASVALQSAALNTTVQADANGLYAFSNIPDGSYVVTPTKPSYAFSPVSQNVTLSGVDRTNINFSATLTNGVVFFDDFTDSAVDTSKWTVMNREGDRSNTELQCYTPANATLAGGNLQITSRAQSATCSGNSYNYTSAMLQWTTYNFTYGTIEIRGRMAGGQGTWPAFWLLGSNCQASNINSADNVAPCHWPDVGSDEIDIAEILSSDHTHVGQFIHSNGNNGGCQPVTSDTSTNFHIYQLIWAPGSVTWKIDGVQSCRLTSGVPSTPMFLMINTAMGGAGGSVNNSTLPQTMLVDYVKVTQ